MDDEEALSVEVAMWRLIFDRIVLCPGCALGMVIDTPREEWSCPQCGATEWSDPRDFSPVRNYDGPIGLCEPMEVILDPSGEGAGDGQEAILAEMDDFDEFEDEGTG